MGDRLSIVVVEPDRERARLIVESLRATGDHEIRVLHEATGLARRIGEADPDIVLIDIADPSRDTLEELALASGGVFHLWSESDVAAAPGGPTIDEVLPLAQGGGDVDQQHVSGEVHDESVY